MNGYVRVGVLPEEDIRPKKLGSKEQTVFKVDIVVPAGILLVVVLLFWAPPCAVQQEEAVVPHPGSSRNQR